MSRPLTADERTSLEHALDLLDRILKCARQIQIGDYLQERFGQLEKEAREIRGLLNSGRIDIESAGPGRHAKTDGSGIHINDAQQMFRMPGDLLLSDCREGYFESAWLLLAMLLHEKYHYDRHTGVLGSLGVVISSLFGGLASVWSVAEGKTLRSLWWHEFKAYTWSYALLATIGYILPIICKEQPGCLPCCDRHLNSLAEAKARQDPWSTYGR